MLQIDGYENPYIAAFDVATEKQRWSTARPVQAQNYSTPIVRRTHDGALEIVTLGPEQIQAMIKAQEAMIASQNLSEEQKKQLLARTRSFMDTTMKPIMEKTEALSIEAYAATFTLEELEGLIAFYQSPVGQKFIEKQPQLMTTLMQQSTARTQSLMPDLLRKMQEETKREIERTRKGQ